MTGPGPIAEPPSNLPTVIAAAVKQLTLDPQAYGISWNLRIATVVKTDPLYAAFDGDDSANGLGMTSMVGPLGVGARVYVLIVPPSGNFIVGGVEPVILGASIDANTSDNGSVAASSGSEVAVPSASYDSEPLYTFEPGYVYQFTVTGFFLATVETDTLDIRVRQGAESTSGTLFLNAQMIAHGGANAEFFTHVGYLKNTTSARVLSRLSVSILRAAGSGTVTIFAAPLILNVTPIGLVSNLTGLAGRVSSVS